MPELRNDGSRSPLARRDAPVVGILGKRGYGKTTRLRERIHATPRVVAWDPLVTPSAPRGQLHLPHRFTDAEECADWIRRHRGRVLRCALHSFERDDFGAIVEAISEGGRCTLAIDEASTLCHRTEPDPALAWILAYGRHLDVEVIWTARRPAEVARLCTSQAEVLEAFRVSDGADLDALRSCFGRDALQRMPRLQRFEFVTTEDE